jgi:basic membrane protein A
MATGELSLSLRGHTSVSWGIAFSPDGTRLATASNDGTAILWDVQSGQRLLRLHGHNGYVNHVAFYPDGTRLATAGQDGTVRLWDTATGQEVLTLRGNSSEIVRLAFSPACSILTQEGSEQCGTRLVTAASDGTMRFYLTRIEDLLGLARARVTRSLTTEECQKYLHLDLDTCSQRYTPQAPLPTEVPSPTPLAATPAGDEGKVCQVTDASGINDQFFNQKTFEGVREAAETFQWGVAVVESLHPSLYQKDISELVQADCDLIVAVSYQLADQLKAAAETSPDQKFLALETFYDPPLNNVRAQIYAVNQAAFLAGYLAASLTQTGKVATFGGFDFPGVTDFMDGFALGVAYYNDQNGTQVEVLGWDANKHDGLFTGDFESIDLGRKLGEQLMNEGADIILPVAGGVGLGTAQAIQERGNAYMIGVDTDWAMTYPEYRDIMLTSIEKRADATVVLTVQAIVDGTFTGGTHIGTLGTGEVGLAPFHEFDSLISDEVKAELEQIREQIVSGEIKTKP